MTAPSLLNAPDTNAIVNLNVGGTKFTTSRSTLTWIPDSFFTSLLSGRIPTLLDETGSIFIDRDPNIFGAILNYLRTKQINLNDVDICTLKHEAQFYGLSPLVKRLILCDELEQSPCGDLLFHAYLPPPPFSNSSANGQSAVRRQNAATPTLLADPQHQPFFLSANHNNYPGSLPPPSNANGGTCATGTLTAHNRTLSEPPNVQCSMNSHSNAMKMTLKSGQWTQSKPLAMTEPKFQAVGHAGFMAGNPSGQEIEKVHGTANPSKAAHAATSGVPPPPPSSPLSSSACGSAADAGFVGRSPTSTATPSPTSTQSAALGVFSSLVAIVGQSTNSDRVALDGDQTPTLDSTGTMTAPALAASTVKPSSNGGPGVAQPVVKPSNNNGCNSSHSRAASADLKPWKSHQRGRGSSDLTRQIKQELLANMKHQQEAFIDPHRVKMIRAHHSWIAVAYQHHVACYRSKDSIGWYLIHLSNRLEPGLEQIALNARAGGASAGSAGSSGAGAGQTAEKLLAASLSDQSIHLWSVNEDGICNRLGVFSLFNAAPVHALLFIGGQLIALSKTGQVGIWHGVTQNWQVQDVLPIASYDTAGSFLLLGCTNGSIYYIDMQKFPLRMKDNDLLITELYRDPSSDPVTSISVYLTPKSSLCGNWIEIAYGTSSGCVRVIVQHPETVGHGPQLFQTFSVHRAPITKVTLTTNHLISVCSEYNHVRTWIVTRFRGMISTQPGSAPLASFKVLTLDPANPSPAHFLTPPTFCDSSSASPAHFWTPPTFCDVLLNGSADVGPFGDQDNEKVFVQKLVPETNQLFVRLASNGERVCVVKSTDESSVTCFLVHECEGSSRMGARPRRFLFTGHVNGSIQMWDLSTALDMHSAAKERGEIFGPTQGPTPDELLRLIDECEITCNSLSVTPINTPAASVLHIPSLFSTNQNNGGCHGNGFCNNGGNHGNGSSHLIGHANQTSLTFPRSSSASDQSSLPAAKSD